MSDHNGNPRPVSDAAIEAAYRTIALRNVNYHGPLDHEGYPPLGLGLAFAGCAPRLDDVVGMAVHQGDWCGGWDGTALTEGLPPTELHRLVERKGWQP
jgi:hypothetical protein